MMEKIRCTKKERRLIKSNTSINGCLDDCHFYALSTKVYRIGQPELLDHKVCSEYHQWAATSNSNRALVPSAIL